jgi:hypothetical protein
MPLTVAEEVSESGPDSNNFVSRTLTFAAPAAIGDRVVVLVDLYTTTGVAATAGMISDDGGHTWVQNVGLTGDGATGGLAILSVTATAPINNITLTPGGSGNYATWGIARLSGPADVDDFDTGTGTSTAPRPADMTATTTDGVALSVISTRGQDAPQTVPSGWTAIELEQDNSSNLAGGIAYSPNIASAGTVTVIWTSTNSTLWFATGVLFKASGGGSGAAFIPSAWRQRTILRRQ